MFQAVIASTEPCSVELRVFSPVPLPVEPGAIDRTGTIIAWALMAALEKNIGSLKEMTGGQIFFPDKEAQAYTTILSFDLEGEQLFSETWVRLICDEINRLAPHFQEALRDPDGLARKAKKLDQEERSYFRRVIESASVFSDTLRAADLRHSQESTTSPRQSLTDPVAKSTDTHQAIDSDSADNAGQDGSSSSLQEPISATPSLTDSETTIDSNVERVCSDESDQDKKANIVSPVQDSSTAETETEQTEPKKTLDYRRKSDYVEAKARLAQSKKNKTEYEKRSLDLAPEPLSPNLYRQTQPGQPLVLFPRAKLIEQCQEKQRPFVLGSFKRQEIMVFEVAKIASVEDSDDCNYSLFGDPNEP
jgi:hypothetical protein